MASGWHNGRQRRLSGGGCGGGSSEKKRRKCDPLPLDPLLIPEKTETPDDGGTRSDDDARTVDGRRAYSPRLHRKSRLYRAEIDQTGASHVQSLLQETRAEEETKRQCPTSPLRTLHSELHTAATEFILTLSQCHLPLLPTTAPHQTAASCPPRSTYRSLLSKLPFPAAASDP